MRSRVWWSTFAASVAVASWMRRCSSSRTATSPAGIAGITSREHPGEAGWRWERRRSAWGVAITLGAGGLALGAARRHERRHGSPSGLEPPAALLVTADHREALYEDGLLGHGQTLSEQQTRVPFIVHEIGGEWPEPNGLADVRGLLRRNLAEQGVHAGPRFVADRSAQCSRSSRASTARG